jgi:hypothetical protein
MRVVVTDAKFPHKVLKFLELYLAVAIEVEQFEGLPEGLGGRILHRMVFHEVSHQVIFLEIAISID